MSFKTTSNFKTIIHAFDVHSMKCIVSLKWDGGYILDSGFSFHFSFLGFFLGGGGMGDDVIASITFGTCSDPSLMTCFQQSVYGSCRVQFIGGLLISEFDLEID